MSTSLSPYTIPLIITGFIALVSSVYTFRQQRVEGSRDLLVLLFAIILWVVTYIFELNDATFEGKLFWAKN